MIGRRAPPAVQVAGGAPPHYTPLVAPARVLIVDPAFVGDVVFSGPLVRALHASLPGVTVGLVVRPPGEQVAARLVGLDRVHVFDKRGEHRGLGGLLRVAASIAEERYEVALLPHPSLRSALLAQRARIPVRIGGRGFPARLALTETVELPEGHVERRLALARDLLTQPADTALSGSLRRSGARAQHSGRARVGLVLGASWGTKRWPVEQLAAFVAGLEPARHALVLLGGTADRETLQALRGLGPIPEDAVDAVGGSLEQLITAIEGCDVVVAGDTGPLQIARGLGVPVVALFGPTFERSHAFAASDRVLTEALDCRPCHHHGPDRCPLGHHRCMRDLDARRVLAALPHAD